MYIAVYIEKMKKKKINRRKTNFSTRKIK